MKKYDPKYIEESKKLLEKIIEYEKRPIIEPSGDVVSVYAVIQVIKENFEDYNKFFYKNIDDRIYRFNRRNGYNIFTPAETTKRGRRVENISFHVNADGTYYIQLDYVDGFGKSIGNGIIDNTVKVDGCDEEAFRNKDFLIKYLAKLDEFALKYPGLDFRWDRNDKQTNSYFYNDGFLYYEIKMDNNDNGPSLTNFEEFNAYREYNNYEIESRLYDDGKYILERLPINLNDIDPYIAGLVRKKYNLEGPKLTK